MVPPAGESPNITDVFDAVRVSGIELAEEQRDFAHKTAISFERIRAGLGGRRRDDGIAKYLEPEDSAKAAGAG